MQELTDNPRTGLSVLDQRAIEEKAYWIKRLSGGAGGSNIKPDHPRFHSNAGERDLVELCISGKCYEQIVRLSDGGQFLLYTTLVAALKVCLHRYSGNTRIIVGSPARAEEDANKERGNVLAIADDVEDRLSFRQLLLNVRESLLEAYGRQHYAYEQLLMDLALQTVDNKSPLFDVMIEMEGLHVEPRQVGCGIRIKFVKGSNAIEGVIEYNTRLYRRETIERFKNHYERVLSAALRDTNTSVGELEMLSEAERQQLLTEWNDTEIDFPRDTFVHKLFEAQVKKAPDAVAVIFGEGNITYQVLNQQANRIAHHLQSLNIKPQSVVALLADRSLELVVALFGILKAGGACLPLDPLSPPAHLSLMLEEAQAHLMITHLGLIDRIPDHSAKAFCLDAEWETVASLSDENPDCYVQPEHPAYVIYTSGSTGKPKGVIVEHRQFSNTICASQSAFKFRADDVMPCFAPSYFDIFFFELLSPLLAGGHSLLVTREQALDASSVVRLLQDVTCMHSVPGLMRHIVKVAEENASTQSHIQLRQIFVGGEEVTPDLLAAIRRTFSSAQIFVLYGPTECAMICASYEVPRADIPPHAMIGLPMANTKLRLYDNHRNLVPAGVTGEIYIGGKSVARGYLKHDDLTSERYVDIDGERFYRSGDRAWRLDDGNIVFAGRADRQVKVRGFRIELGAIEAVLIEHSNVQQAIVTVQGQNGNERLIAFIVPGNDDIPKTDELRSFVESSLPLQMVPSAFIFLKEMPLTANGKIDRQSLVAPAAYRPELSTAHLAPATLLDKDIAAVWEEVLGLQNVGVNDNFFDVGGTSILLVQIQSELRKRLQQNLTIAELFKYPTIKSLSGRISQLHNIEPSYQQVYRRIQRQKRIVSQPQRRSLNRNPAESEGPDE